MPLKGVRHVKAKTSPKKLLQALALGCTMLLMLFPLSLIVNPLYRKSTWLWKRQQMKGFD